MIPPDKGIALANRSRKFGIASVCDGDDLFRKLAARRIQMQIKGGKQKICSEASDDIAHYVDEIPCVCAAVKVNIGVVLLKYSDVGNASVIEHIVGERNHVNNVNDVVAVNVAGKTFNNLYGTALCKECQCFVFQCSVCEAALRAVFHFINDIKVKLIADSYAVGQIKVKYQQIAVRRFNLVEVCPCKTNGSRSCFILFFGCTRILPEKALFPKLALFDFGELHARVVFYAECSSVKTGIV